MLLATPQILALKTSLAWSCIAKPLLDAPAPSAALRGRADGAYAGDPPIFDSPLTAPDAASLYRAGTSVKAQDAGAAVAERLARKLAKRGICFSCSNERKAQEAAAEQRRKRREQEGREMRDPTRDHRTPERKAKDKENAETGAQWVKESKVPAVVRPGPAKMPFAHRSDSRQFQQSSF